MKVTVKVFNITLASSTYSLLAGYLYFTVCWLVPSWNIIMALLTLGIMVFLTPFIIANQFISPTDIVEFALKSYGIVPDLIRTLPVVPIQFITVTYPSCMQVILGNVFGLDQVQDQPTSVMFYACPDRYYTLILLDPDVPSRRNTSLASVRHWHVGNIPGDVVSAGEVLANYWMPMPAVNTGPHRYVFLCYRQKKKLVFREPRICNSNDTGRTGFSIDSYVKKYDLTLISANFFQAERDNYCCRQFQPVTYIR